MKTQRTLLSLLNKAPPRASEAAARLVAAGVERYGDLGLGAPELASWIELVVGNRELAPEKLNADLYLAAALAKGVPAAWALWRDQLELPLVRWLTRLAGGVRLGEELVAELAGDLFAGKLREYRGESALRTWLTVVARNRLTDKLRSESRRGVSLSLWASGEPRGEVAVSPSDVAEEVVNRCDGERLGKALKEVLEKLGVEEKRLLVRYFLEDTRMRVLARDCGVNRTQVGRRLKAVCARVKAALAGSETPAEYADGPAPVTLEVLRLLEIPGEKPSPSSGAPGARTDSPEADEAAGDRSVPRRAVAVRAR